MKVWNKGFTKETNQSVKKISKTMKRRKLDNFKQWRDRAKTKGGIKSQYLSFKKNGDLAELIGAILGDGNIYKFERTEGLRIVGNSRHEGFVKRYAKLMEKVIGKKPHVAQRNDSYGTNITLYEKHLGKRLGIPTGSKKEIKWKVPKWILENENYVHRYLRGLYETDGSTSVHLATYTHKFMFSNKNESLLCIVFNLMCKLGFHPHRSKYMVQISRKEEVQKAKNLLQFRQY